MYQVIQRDEAVQIIADQIHKNMMRDHAFMLDLVTNGFPGVSNYTDEELVEEAEDLNIAGLLVTRGVFAGGKDRALGEQMSPLGDGVLDEQPM
jgi:hypothetical protein